MEKEKSDVTARITKDIPYVRVYEILIGVLALFYFAGFVGILYTLVHDFPGPAKSRYVNFLAMQLSVLIIAIIYLIVLYQLYRLFVTVVRRDPYNPKNPGRIRIIAYGAFILAAVNMIHELVFLLATYHAPSIWEYIFWAVYRTAQMALFGLGILIVAKIHETGVRLQQEQNLTI